MKSKQVIVTLLSGLFFLLCSFPVAAQPKRPPAQVQVKEVEFRSMVATAMMPGTVVSREDARISAEVSGRLLAIADIGTRVEKGEVIARIDDTRFKLQQRELAAQVAREKARLNFLQAEEKRLSRLAKKNLASTTQYEQTTADRQVAESDLTVAEVRLEQAQDELMRSKISAPFPGVVVARLSNPGERLAVGTEVLRLVNDNNLEVVARAPLEYMPFSQRGDKLEITGNAGSMMVPVRTLVAVGNERTHVYEMRLDLPAKVYPVGKTLRVRIPVATSAEVLAIPRDALVLRSQATTVFVISMEGKARQVRVETGISEQQWIAVEGDLQAGDKVVIRGAERLRPGQQVSIQESTTNSSESSSSYTDTLELEKLVEPESEPEPEDGSDTTH
ncbi:MAG: efflux RND transporter periplasmic adaptor subunit [Xanthomonadales bacterium]|nr:efflux RND transporter periplasmic adaptor subunit [Xanthomonadales bacterium]